MTDNPHTTDWRLEYTGPTGGTIRITGILDDAPVWTFCVNDLSAEYNLPMVDVVVPHYSFMTFAIARAFFTDLAAEGPDTLDQVAAILNRNGFVRVSSLSAATEAARSAVESELDARPAGMQPGELRIVAAAPGAGTTVKGFDIHKAREQ